MGRHSRRLDPDWLLAQVSRVPYGYRGWCPGLRRSQRRQLRKRLGRLRGVEWRSFGNVRGRDGVMRPAKDALNDQIVSRAREVGHVAQHVR